MGRILWYEFCRWLTRAVYRLLYRPIIIDPHNVPHQGPCLLVANHQSYLDPPLVGIYAVRHPNYIARSGLFKNALFARLIASLNATPVKEEGSDAAAIKEVLRRLADGNAVVIFPEGSRTPDGALHEFKRGVALLVKKAKCPVVPVALEGCFDAFPRGSGPRFFWRGPRFAVRYGPAIALDDLLRDGPDATLRLLEKQIEAMRLDLRARLRAANVDVYPANGPGDQARRSGLHTVRPEA
jgi:1-acyl-sn-glycerol-3-phosphate acyltransferase